MSKRLIIIAILIISLISITFILAESNQTPSLEIKRSGGWELIKHDGIQYQYFKTTLEDLGNGMAKICLIPKTEMMINDPIITQSKAHLRKDGIDTGEVEPGDMEVEKEAGKVKKMCVNVDKNNEDWIRFGEKSTVYEYKEIATVRFDIHSSEINATLYCENGDNLNPLIVNQTGLKFGGNLTNVNSNTSCYYLYESNKGIDFDGKNYYVQTTNKVPTTIGEYAFDIARINLEDICYFNESTDFSSNCLYYLINGTLIVNFTAEYISGNSIFIDPSYTITSMPGTESIQEEVRVEGNYSHLSIDTSSSPYNSLIAYWNFDGELENTEDFTTYDWTDNDLDGDGIGNAVANETSCVYGDCLQLDGTGDCMKVTKAGELDNIGKGNLTLSFWFKRNGASSDPVEYLISTGSVTANYSFELRPTTVLDAYIGKARYYKNVQFSNDVWYNLVVVVNYTSPTEYNTTFYSNGVLIADDSNIISGTKEVDIGGTEFIIGGYRSSDCYGSRNGSVDEVMIFNNSLTPAQISDIYNNASARFVDSGNQTFKQFNLNLDQSWLQISESSNQLFGSSMKKRIAEWNQSNQGYNETDFDNQLGLVSYWHFDEDSWDGTSNEVVDSVGSNHGTAFGDADTSGGGYFYRAGNFDGEGDYVEVSGGMNYSNLTISMWIKPSNKNSDYYAGIYDDLDYANDDGFGIMFVSSYSTLNFYGGNDNTGTASSGISTGNWYHIVATFDGSDNNASLYINGIIKSSKLLNALSDYTRGTLDIGRYAGNNEFNGSIDEVMVFNRSLSADEIKSLYIGSPKSNQTGVLWNYSYYRTSDFFNVERGSSNFLVEYEFVAGTNNFYSPILLASTNNVINVTSDNNITNCSYLMTPNTVYTMLNDIKRNDLTKDCIAILAENVTFNCSYYKINSDDSYSGIFSNQQNSTIDGCSVSMGSSFGGMGVELAYSNNHTVRNSNFTLQYYGIYVGNSNGTNITNTTSNSNTFSGIILNSDSCSVSNSTFNSNGFSGIELYGNGNILSHLTSNYNNDIGIRAPTGDKNLIVDVNASSQVSNEGINLGGNENVLRNVNTTNNKGYGISVSGSNNNVSGYVHSNVGYGVYTAGGTGNIFSVNTSGSSNGYYVSTTGNVIEDANILAGIYLSGGGGHVIRKSVIVGTTYLVSESGDQFINDSISTIDIQSSSTNVTLLNCTVSGIETVESGSQLFRKWFYKAYVNDSNEQTDVPIKNANISVYNSSGKHQFNLTTDSTGFTKTHEIIEYVNDGGTRISYSNYTIYVSNESYPMIYRGYNVSKELNNLNDVFGMDKVIPNMTIIIPPTGRIFENFVSEINIEANFSTNDVLLNECWYGINGTISVSNTSVSCSSGYNNFTFQLLSPGEFSFNIYGNDTAGNENSSSIYFKVLPYTGPTGGGAGFSGGNYYQYNDTIICKNVYYFIINHLDKNGSITYSVDDLDDLSYEITLELGTKILPSKISSYVENYPEKCGNLTDLKIPEKEKPLAVVLLNNSLLTGERNSCSNYINQSFLGVSLDWGIPWWEWKGPIITNVTCDEIDLWRWFWKYEKIDENDYVFLGIKTYIPFTILLLTGLVVLIIYLVRNKKKIDFLTSKVN